MIPESANNKLDSSVRFTPRLATASEYRLDLRISATDHARFDALEAGTPDPVEVTDLATGTRWQARKAPCVLTENGFGCYCDAIALPIEHGRLAELPVELEAPLDEQLRGVHSILDSAELHPSHRLNFEQAARELETEINRRRAVTELRATIEETFTRLDDRKLPAAERAHLEQTLAEKLFALGQLDGFPVTVGDVTGIDGTEALIEALAAELDDELDDVCEELHDLGGDSDRIRAITDTARTVARAQANGDPDGVLEAAALERLEEILDGSCPSCAAAALAHLARHTD